VAINCPKCKTRTLFSDSEVGAAGRLVQCPRCGTTWLARHFDVDVYGPQARCEPPPAARPPIIIEGEVAVANARRPQRPSAAARPTAPAPSGVGRYGFAAGATMLVLALVAVVLLAPAVSALPGGAVGGGIALRSVESRTLTLRGADALLVEGELYNPGDREAAVPGVRISLRSAEAEIYSWLVEPARQSVAPGRAVGFRSALADPPAGVDRVSVSLAARGGTTLGSR
jgi:predicted Zn finger-like uncharacterized protein